MDKEQRITTEKRLVNEANGSAVAVETPYTLADALGRLTKADLTQIRIATGIKGASSLKKQELAEALARHIPAVLPGLLNLLDETRYKTLKKIAESGGKGFVPLEPGQLDYWMCRGLLFSGTVNGKQTLSMPQEILDGIKESGISPLREKIRLNTEWIKLAQGALYYYGVLGIEQLMGLVKQHTGSDPDLHEFISVLEDAVLYYGEMEIHDRTWFAHSCVLDIETVIRDHTSRPEISFYPFSKSELLAAGEPSFTDRNPYFRAFADLICKSFSLSRLEAEELVEECVFGIEIGKSPNDLLSFLQHQLNIADMAMIRAFADHIVSLHNNTRQWCIKGYTPNELSESKRSGLPAPAVSAASNGSKVVELRSSGKAGRNDPCPCGSGKKYKKCCLA